MPRVAVRKDGKAVGGVDRRGRAMECAIEAPRHRPRPNAPAPVRHVVQEAFDEKPWQLPRQQLLLQKVPLILGCLGEFDEVLQRLGLEDLRRCFTDLAEVPELLKSLIGIAVPVSGVRNAYVGRNECEIVPVLVTNGVEESKCIRGLAKVTQKDGAAQVGMQWRVGIHAESVQNGQCVLSAVGEDEAFRLV